MDISAKQVLDPTLLMDADAWSEYVKPMKKPEKYVLVYQIHANSDLDHYAVKFAEKAELPLLRVSPGCFTKQNVAESLCTALISADFWIS